jgi:predicted GNAT family acetyltransferase
MGRNNADFNGVTFRYDGEGPMNGFEDFPLEEAPLAHVFTAHKQGQQVGKLQLQPGGTIDHVEVDEEHQRQGIATGLHRFATNYADKSGGEDVPYPVHSPIRSEEGDAWAKKIGGYLPPNEA